MVFVGLLFVEDIFDLWDYSRKKVTRRSVFEEYYDLEDERC